MTLIVSIFIKFKQLMSVSGENKRTKAEGSLINLDRHTTDSTANACFQIV